MSKADDQELYIAEVLFKLLRDEHGRVAVKLGELDAWIHQVPPHCKKAAADRVLTGRRS
jgi:hypothetical protein